MRTTQTSHRHDGDHCPDGLTETLIDALLEEVDRELVREAREASVAYRYDFTDQRRAGRARRRAGREALRSLPTQLHTARPIESEAA